MSIRCLIFLLAVAVPVASLCPGCKYAGCPSIICSSGWKNTGGSACCKKVFGQCVALKVECAPAKCSWTDLSCNLKGVTDLFSGLDTALQGQWNKLSTTVQAGLKDKDSFAKLSVADLKTISGAMLSHSKAAAGITAEQLGGVASQLQEMLPSEAQKFVSSLNKDNLDAGLENLGKAGNWAADKASPIVARVAQSDMWNTVDTWGKDKFAKLGNLVAGIKTSELAQVPNLLISDPVVAGKLVAAQIGPLAQKAGTMTTKMFSNFYNNLPPGELKKALDTTGKVAEWGRDKMKFLYRKLQEEEFFGDFKTWTVDTFKLLGAIAGPIVLEGKISHIDKDTFKAVGKQLVKGIILARTFAFAVLKFKVMVLGDIAIKVSELVGGDAEKYTKDIVALAGPAIIALAELGSMPFDIILDSTILVIDQGFDWSAITPDMAKNFAARMKKSDAYGIVSQWTSKQIKKVSEILPVVLTKEDIGKLDKQAFVEAFADIRKVADKDGFTPEQREALGRKALEAFGDAKDWSTSKAQEVGTIVAGLSVADLKGFKDEVVATLKPAVVAGMDKFQLNGLGQKLSKLSKEAKESVYGKKLRSLSVQAKQSLLDCMCTCKAKFVDFVITFKDIDQGMPTNLQKFVEKASQVSPTDVKKLLDHTANGEKTTVFRISTTDPADIADKINSFVQQEKLVDDQVMLLSEAVTVDPQVQYVDPTNSASLAAPSLFCVAVAAVAVLL